MMAWLQRISLGTVVAAVTVLVATSLPTWWGAHLDGYRLLGHMLASGLVVVGLPAYALLRWSDRLYSPVESRTRTVTFWTLVCTGFLTIASMFACMLPSTPTPSMVALIDFHGWIGSTMAVATVAHLLRR